MNYKIGDKFKSLIDYEKIKKGDILTLTAIKGGGNLYHHFCRDIDKESVCLYYDEPGEEDEVEPYKKEGGGERSCKSGDKVKVVGNTSPTHYYSIGDVVKVHRTLGNRVSCIDKKGMLQTLCVEDVELCKDEKKPERFKVGDTVRIICCSPGMKNDPHAGKLGRLDTVKKAQDEFVYEVRGEHLYCMTRYVEAVEMTKETAYKFKVGDRVIATGKNKNNTYKGVVTEANKYHLFVLRDSDGATWECKILPDGRTATANGMWDEKSYLDLDWKADETTSLYDQMYKHAPIPKPGMIQAWTTGIHLGRDSIDTSLTKFYLDQFVDSFNRTEYPFTKDDAIKSEKSYNEGRWKKKIMAIEIGTKYGVKKGVTCAGWKPDRDKAAYIIYTDLIGEGTGMYTAYNKQGLPVNSCSMCIKAEHLVPYGSVLGHKKGIMSTLSTMASKLLDGDVKTFVEAGILDSELNITSEGRDFVLTQVLDANKKAYAIEAKKLVEAAKKDC